MRMEVSASVPIYVNRDWRAGFAEQADPRFRDTRLPSPKRHTIHQEPVEGAEASADLKQFHS
jgi:hypothetical protein